MYMYIYIYDYKNDCIYIFLKTYLQMIICMVVNIYTSISDNIFDYANIDICFQK